AGRGVFLEHEYTERGKWMDGWETRRKREPGHDWCVIRLGLPGIIRGFDVDTNHFKGNFPESCSIEAACVDGPVDVEELTDGPGAAWGVEWGEVRAKTKLQGHSQNLLKAGGGEKRFTHLRLNIYPDGGVARLRVHGEPVADWARLARRNIAGEKIDLAAIENG